MVLSVIVMHSGVHAADQLSWAAVVLFFVSSGFLLSMKHPVERPTIESCRSSWIHLARKVYPLHLLALAALCLITWRIGAFTFTRALPLEAMLIQSWFPSRDIFLSYNKPSWFLATLLALYALYPLLRSALNHLSLRARVATVIVFTTAMAVLMYSAPTGTLTYMHVCPLVRVGDFLWGMVAHDVWQSPQWQRYSARVSSNVLEIGAVALLCLFIFIDIASDDALLAWNSNLLFWLPVSILVLTCATSNRREGIISRIMIHSPFTFFGGISLELYLLHCPVAAFIGVVLPAILEHWQLTLAVPGWTVVLTALIIVSWVTNRVTQRIKRIKNKNKANVAL